MCNFWSGYMNEAGEIFDEFPYESHSDVTNRPADAAALETFYSITDELMLDVSQHTPPAWFSDAHKAKLFDHVAARKAELDQYGQTERAKKQRTKQLAELRKLFPNEITRKIIIEKAGHGDPITALHHILHARAEREQAQQAEDELMHIHRNAARAWLLGLSKSYLRQLCDNANYRARTRCIFEDDVKHMIILTCNDGKQRKTRHDVANAYRKFGRPSGTFAVVDLDARQPLRVYRSTF